MTRELQRAIQAMAVECDDTYAMANSIEDMLEEIFDDHEAQLKAKDKEIERLKAESKQSYIEGSKSCDDLLSFYITKIASLEEKLKVSNDSAIK